MIPRVDLEDPTPCRSEIMTTTVSFCEVLVKIAALFNCIHTNIPSVQKRLRASVGFTISPSYCDQAFAFQVQNLRCTRHVVVPHSVVLGHVNSSFLSLSLLSDAFPG